MATHSNILAWHISWMEEPGRLQSMRLLGVGHDWATSLSLFTFRHWRRKWQPTPVFLPGESRGWGSLVTAVYGVVQSRTRLKWLSSSSSSNIIWPNNPTIENKPEKTIIKKDTCTPMFIETLSTIARMLNQPRWATTESVYIFKVKRKRCSNEYRQQVWG